MTKRSRPGRTTARIASADVPALAAFARGYLHQDLLVENGSPAEAARAFAHDANEAERRALAADLIRVKAAAVSWSSRRLSHWFRDELGAAWLPDRADELDEILNALS